MSVYCIVNNPSEQYENKWQPPPPPQKNPQKWKFTIQKQLQMVKVHDFIQENFKFQDLIIKKKQFHVTVKICLRHYLIDLIQYLGHVRIEPWAYDGSDQRLIVRVEVCSLRLIILSAQELLIEQVSRQLTLHLYQHSTNIESL